MTAEHAPPAQSPDWTCSTVLSRLTAYAVLFVLLVSAAGCAAVGSIFKAGIWVGVIVAALVIVVVLFLVRSVSR